MPASSPPAFARALVAVHLSPTDGDLLAYTGMLARRGVIGEARFVHVEPPPDPEKSHPDFGWVINRMKSAAEEHFAGEAGRIRRTYDLRHGPLFDELLAYAAEEETDLVLVGHRRDHPLRRSLARRLATKAPCSVWLMPEGAPAAIGRILVPIDFSSRAADALGQACAVAARAGLAEVQALHVYFDASRTTYDDADAVVRGHEAEAFRRFVAPIDTCGVRVAPRFESGAHPAHAITRVAAEIGADLIVLETRGRSGSAAILLGSVAEETLVESRVPVLVVKHFGARMGVLKALLDRTFRRPAGLEFD